MYVESSVNWEVYSVSTSIPNVQKKKMNFCLKIVILCFRILEANKNAAKFFQRQFWQCVKVCYNIASNCILILIKN